MDPVRREPSCSCGLGDPTPDWMKVTKGQVLAVLVSGLNRADLHCVCVLCMLVLPVDVYVVSSNIDSQTGRQLSTSDTTHDLNVVKLIYYVLYAAVAVCACIALPFVFFYYEEQDEDSTWQERAWMATKYTIVFVIIVVVLLILGAFLKHDSSSGDSQQWVNVLKDSWNTLDRMLSFFVGCLSTLGFFGVIFYTAYGLAYFPIDLIRSRQASFTGARPQLSSHSSINNRKSSSDYAYSSTPTADIDLQIKRNTERIKYLTSSYALSSKDWTQADRIKLHELQREERRLKSLKDQTATSTAAAETLGCCGRCLDAIWTTVGWVRAVIGSVMLCFSLFLVTSLLISNIDKALHSYCGVSCGFALDDPQILNPVNEMLVLSSKIFPVDYLLFAGIVIYLLICTIAAMTSLGIRLICVTYQIRKGRSMHNSLILMAFFLIFIVLAINVQVQTLAPQYSSFGDQFFLKSNAPAGNGTTTNVTSTIPAMFRPGYFTTSLVSISSSSSSNATVTYTKTPCTLVQFGKQENGNNDLCVLTQVSRFSHQMTSTMPFFGVIFYYANWAFLAAFFLCLLFVSCRGAEADRESSQRLLDDEASTEAV